MTQRPALARWLVVACCLLASTAAALAVFWSGVFSVFRGLWPRLPPGWSGAIGLALALVALVSGVLLYFVLLRFVMVRTGVRRSAASGQAFFVGALPLFAAVWVLAAIAVVRLLAS
jgi:hypothetical protein